MKRIIIFCTLWFLNYSFYAQNSELICTMNHSEELGQKLHLKGVSCTSSSQYWNDNSLYVPDENQNVIFLKANFIFLTKPDGTGNFEENNLEHQQVINDIINTMNYRLANLVNPTNPSCTNVESGFISDTKIQVIVNKIWRIDPAWDFLVTGFSPGNNITSSVLYPPNSNYYYSYFENDQTIPEGVNIVFANNGDIYQELVVNQNYNDSYPFQLWAASQFPSTSNLSRSSRQFYPDAYNRYVWFKERVTVEQNLPWNTVRGWYIGTYGNNFFPHEFGHSLWLYHQWSCGENVMYGGWPSSNTYLRPVSEVGKMYRAASITNMRNFFTDDSYTNSNIKVNNNENWDLDFRLYSDILVENESELNLTCNLILPPQSRIKVKGNSVLKIEGGVISSANNTNWNGIKIQDNSSLEILPGTEINNGYFYAYTDNSLNKSIKKQKIKTSNILPIVDNNKTNSSYTSSLIYPNPSKGFLNVNLKNNNEIIGSQLKIIDINGKVLIKQKLLMNFTKIDVHKLKKGVYYILIGKESKFFIKDE